MKPSVRPRLLEAAIDLFTERGFSGVNVQDILLKASTNLNSFRTYFTDKKGAFAATLEEALERAPSASEMAMSVVQNRKKHDLRLVVREMVQTWYTSLSRQTAKLLMHALLSGNEDWRRKAGKYLSDITDVVTSCIEAESPKGAKGGFDPEAAAKSLVLALFALSVTEGPSKISKTRSAQVELIMNQCLLPFFTSGPKEK